MFCCKKAAYCVKRIGRGNSYKTVNSCTSIKNGEHRSRISYLEFEERIKIILIKKSGDKNWDLAKGDY